MGNETGKGEFPCKQFENVLLHSLRVMDQNREYLQMHLGPDCDEKTQQALQDLEQESVRMERTLREMLELLTVEQQPPQVLKPVDLCRVLAEVEQMAPEVQRQVDTRLTVDYGGLERCFVRADPDMAEQLCYHLLSNALRAVSPGGQVVFRLAREESTLCLTVEDDGCGLPSGENWMENRRRFLGGAQAGLLLCRKYCARLGWELSLSARVPRGTQASLVIPAAGQLCPLSGTVELCSDAAEAPVSGLRWLLLRELALLTGRSGSTTE